MFASWRTLVTCVVGCLWWPTWASATPSLQVDTPTLDLGTHLSGTSFEHCIRLSNRGDQPLTIGGFTSGCMCVQTRVDQASLGPGESTVLTLTIDPADMWGEIRRVVEFTSNDPKHPQIHLRLRYYIAGPAVLSASELRLGALEPGQSCSRVVQVQSGKDTVELRKVESNHNAIQTTILRPLATASQPAEVAIHYTSGENTGSLSGKVTVHTSAATRPALELPVEATVTRDLHIEPAELNFGAISIGQEGTLSLRITCASGTRIDSITCADPLIQIQPQPVEPTSENSLVHVTVAPKSEIGPFSSLIVIRTSGHETQHLTIPVKGETLWSEPTPSASVPGALALRPVANSEPAAATQPAAPTPPATVRIDFPDEVEAQAVVDYVSQTLGVNILYDETIKGKKLTLRSPEPVPKRSLLELLRAILQAKGLALVDADQPGWYKVIPTANLSNQVRAVQDQPSPSATTGNRVVSQVLRVQAANSAKISAALKGFLTTPGGSMVTVEASGPQHLLIVTDFEPVIATVDRLTRLMDVPAPDVQIKFLTARHRAATELATEATRILGDVAKLGGLKDAATISGDAATGGLVLIGLPEQLAQAEALIAQMDTALPATVGATKRYAPKFVDVNRLRSLVEQLVLGGAKDGKSGVRTIVDADTNSLYVVGPPTVQQQIQDLVSELDAAPPESSRPVRFYCPVNRPAAELFETLSELLGEGGSGTPRRDRGSAGSSPTHGLSTRELTVPGPNRAPTQGRGGAGGGAMQTLPEPPALVSTTQPAGSARAAVRKVAGADYNLTIDEHTNTIIAAATPELHRQIEQLIKQLDRRRPQVLIEVTVMTLELTDSLSLGVELESFELGGTKSDYITFSAFGLSQVNAANGALTLAPGVGFNGAILSPDELNVVVNALATHGRSHVIATPRILVDDNGSASISSVSESPFTSVNASTTVATTSFAGFAEAGTTLTVQPHINEGDHLQLAYTLTFSSFTGGSSNNGTVPPPRSSNNISSSIAVPDGYTAVIGGLQTDRTGDTISEVPLLGRIPLVGLLFQNSSRSSSQSRLYAFIRPIILRDDQFEDLKFISQADLQAAEIKARDFPESQYQWMR